MALDPVADEPAQVRTAMADMRDGLTWLVDLEDMSAESDDWTVLFLGTLGGGVRPTSIISKLDKIPSKDELASLTESAVAAFMAKAEAARSD